MLIGLCGGICSGKHSVADFLVQRHGFQRLDILRKIEAPKVEKSAEGVKINGHSLKQIDGDHGRPTFATIDELLEFVTARWRQHFVMTDIWDEASLDILIKRPFFFLISVDAPVSIRWKRLRNRCQSQNLEPPSLEDFVLSNDDHLYDKNLGLVRVLDRAQLRLLNSSPSIEQLHTELEKLNLINEERLRPSWDQYFMQLANLAAQRCNCMKRRVGCVLVRDKRVISTGYNGTPRNLRNCNEGGCPRCNNGQGSGVSLSTCLCLHAEENALLEAGRDRIGQGSILYCDTCPCLTCSIKLTQVGISEVVYSQSYTMDAASTAVFEEAGVKFRQYSPPLRGLVNLDP